MSLREKRLREKCLTREKRLMGRNVLGRNVLRRNVLGRNVFQGEMSYIPKKSKILTKWWLIMICRWRYHDVETN